MLLIETPLVVALLTMTAALLMLQLGVAKRRLAWRPRRIERERRWRR